MRRSTSFFKGLLLSSLFVFSYAEPPPLPSAGVVERQLEKEYEVAPIELEKTLPSIQIDIPDEQLVLPEGKKVFVREIHLSGNTIFSSEELGRIIKKDLGRELSLKEIYELCGKIDRYYAKKGYFLARSYPPPQLLGKGSLKIQILEGVLGDVEIRGNDFYSSSYIKNYFRSLLHRPLQYDAFLKALLLLNENADLHASSLFIKGKKVGTADVIIEVKDKRPLHLYFNGNNYGKFLTTNTRVGGRFDAGSLLLYGDKLSVAEVVGTPINALYFTDVIYNVPLNAKGTHFELAYLYSKFKVEEMLNLHLKGQSNIGTLKLSQALTRTKAQSIDLFTTLDFKQIENIALGSTISFDKLRVLTLGSTVDLFGSKTQRDYLNIRFAYGIPNFLGGLDAVDPECSRVGAGGRFFMANIDYDHLQYLFKDWIFSFHGSGQVSPYKLPVPQQIYIGGADTIRGFPLASALGDMGYYMNFELHVPPPVLANQKFFMLKETWREVFQLVAFLDQGGVFLHSGPAVFEWGAGIGFRFKGPWHLDFSLDVGFPLNRHDLTPGTMTYMKLTWQPF